MAVGLSCFSSTLSSYVRRGRREASGRPIVNAVCFYGAPLPAKTFIVSCPPGSLEATEGGAGGQEAGIKGLIVLGLQALLQVKAA